MSVPLFVLIVFVLLPLTIAACSLAPWAPTHTRDFPRIHRHLRLRKGSVCYELGCGDGRVCRSIARAHPDARVIGVEMALPLYLLARLRQLVSPLPNLTIRLGNALRQDLSDADAIYTYAMIATINGKLKPAFLRMLRPGCRIVSYEFAMADWPGGSAVDPPGNGHGTLHVYDVP